jgi:hypothetical protein
VRTPVRDMAGRTGLLDALGEDRAFPAIPEALEALA